MPPKMNAYFVGIRYHSGEGWMLELLMAEIQQKRSPISGFVIKSASPEGSGATKHSGRRVSINLKTVLSRPCQFECDLLPHLIHACIY